MSREADLRYDNGAKDLSEKMRWEMNPSKEEAEIQVRILDHYIKHPREYRDRRDEGDVDGGDIQP